MGSRVLAQQKNKLWHRCVILKTPKDKSDQYEVKFEASGTVIEVKIDDLLPLGIIIFIIKFFRLKLIKNYLN